MDIFETFEARLKQNPRTMRRRLLPEGTDPRILNAASRLLANGTLNVILLSAPADVAKAPAETGFDVSKATVIDPLNYPEMDKMADKMVELRKGKMTEEACAATLTRGNYFGTMLVKMGKADCLLGGATYSTADTVRPALQLIKYQTGQ